MSEQAGGVDPADYDVVVIGGGPAGWTAATWLGRYRRSALVVDGQQYRNRWVEKVHGVLANDPVPPQVLLQQARTDLERYGSVRLTPGTVAAVTRVGSGRFRVELEDVADPLLTRRIVLATGVRDVFPEVAAFFEHYGADVFHCPTCDGSDACGECVAVFGRGEHVAGFALELLDWAPRCGSSPTAGGSKATNDTDRHSPAAACSPTPSASARCTTWAGRCCCSPACSDSPASAGPADRRPRAPASERVRTRGTAVLDDPADRRLAVGDVVDHRLQRPQLLAQHPSDMLTRRGPRIPQRQHLPDLLQAQPQVLCSLDEHQPGLVLGSVDAVAGTRARRLGQQPDGLVVADGLGIRPDPVGQLSHAHPTEPSFRLEPG
jgi:hypothetical protein